MNDIKRRCLKSVIICLLVLIAALCACAFACACGGGKNKIEADFGSGGFVTDKDKWNIYDGLAVGFINKEDCRNGEIDETRIVPELNAKINERYYMVADFTIKAPQNNDGRESVTAEIKISPANVASATVHETNTGNVTEVTAENVTTIKAVYRIPDKASVARKIRIVVSVDAEGRDLVNIGLKLNCPPNMPSVSTIEMQKQAAVGCAERLSTANFYDGKAICCQVIAVADEGADRIVIPNMVDGKFVKRVVSFSKTEASYIAVPDSVTQIDMRAFSGCANLKSFFVHSGITKLGNELFIGCTSLENITVDESNADYYSRDGVLYDKVCENILWIPAAVKGEVNVPDGITEIAERAFAGCEGLTRITLPDSIKEIGTYAFLNCTALTIANLPDSLVSIGLGAFSRCESLENASIPDGVSTISDRLFANCKSLKSVTLPSGIGGIGEYVFEFCSKLEEINFPDGVDSIGEGAFFGCAKLKSLTLPDSLKSVGNMAFASCMGVTEIKLGSGLTEIGNRAFANCTGVTEVVYNGTSEQWEEVNKAVNWTDRDFVFRFEGK